MDLFWLMGGCPWGWQTLADGEMAPDRIENQQGSDHEKHIANANFCGNMPAKESASEHADELRRLIEAIDTSQADRRCELANQIIG